jgi:L-2,4-diaminobutyrate transaminase
MTAKDALQQMSLEEMDRQGLFHPNTDLRAFAHGELGDPHIISSAKGVRIYDQHGKEYIDAFAGLWCVNVGYGREEIAEAMYEQAKRLAYYHTHWAFSNEPAIRLTDRVLRMAPEGMSKIFWGLQGSDAHETQVKIAWYYNNVLGRPKKKKIIARERGYHGLTIMSGSLTGLPVLHATFDLPMERVRHTMAPYYYRREDRSLGERDFSRLCAQRLDALIESEGPDTVAAFIAEPVVGVGGIIPSPEGYWEDIQAVLQKHDVLLMVDEVVCGFGRLGTNFGCDYYGIHPDMMCISKGLTSAYFPLAGSILSDKVWSVLEEGSRKYGPFAHGFTYAAHPLGAATAMANLDILERENLKVRAGEIGGYLLKQLRAAFSDHEMVGDVRGIGLLAAIEFVADKRPPRSFHPDLELGTRIARACREEGVIVRPLPHGDILGFSPPLIVTREEIDEIVERCRRAVARVRDEMIRSGDWRPT